MDSDQKRALSSDLGALDPRREDYATRFVDLVLAAAKAERASDLHLQPTPAGIELRWRLNGVLAFVGNFPAGETTNVVTRLKVLAELLTYRNDTPQEGRILKTDERDEMRLSVFPTIYGEKAVVRLFQSSGGDLQRLDDLSLPPEIVTGLRRLLGATSGAILVTGPAGSGKTTTLYACLRELLRQSRGARNIVTLEDPVELAIEGVSQSQVNPIAGFDLASGLKSVLRQDPEVILVGEIRDRATAEVALQASLTGQLVLSSFHAGSAASAVSRLTDMGIEPYILRSGLLAVVSQRLARRLCHCSRPAERAEDFLGLEVRRAHLAVGCPDCLNTGYTGRIPLAEMLLIDQQGLGASVLERSPAAQIEALGVAAGMVTLAQRALAAVEAGQTDPAEVRRVLGFSDAGPEKAIP